MGVYEKMFFKFSQNFLSKARLKIFLVDSHYKTIFVNIYSFVMVVYKRIVRMACPSYTV